MSDRNEWFKDVKRLVRGLEVSCGETVGADVTATAYIEDIKYCPFCGEEL